MVPMVQLPSLRGPSASELGEWARYMSEQAASAKTPELRRARAQVASEFWLASDPYALAIVTDRIAR